MKKELINKLDDYMLSALKSEDSSAFDSFLESYGCDLAVVNSIADKSFKQINFTLKGQMNFQKDEILLEKVAKYFQDAINKNIEKPISYLRNLVESNQLAFGHRNLEKLTSDDIKELIKDHNLLDILEKLENDEEL